MRSTAILLTLGLVAFSLVVSPGLARAEELPPAVLKKARSATVFIKVTRPDKKPRGSGFFISPELIVTNAHVLGISENESRLPEKVEVVLNSGSPDESVVVARVQAVNVDGDLAYLEVPRQGRVQFLTLRPSNEIVETLPVCILGFPLGERLDPLQRNPAVTISSGHVSSLRRDEEKQIREIQIDGSLIPGNSGGPIVDAKGELVAVSAAAIVGLKIGFSIPSDIVQADLEGTIDSVDYQYQTQANGLYTIKASAKTVDPLRRIKRLALYYWTGRPGSKRPSDPQGKFGTYGAPGDGPRKHVELSLDRHTGLWSGQIANVSMPPDQDFWTQPAIATAKGVSRSTPTDHAEYLRQATDTGKPVASPARSVRRKSRSRRPAPGELPQDPDTAEIANELAERFKEPRRPSAVSEPVAPASQVALEATQQRDESGYPYALARTRAQVISLGEGKLIQLAVDPSGSRIFAIYEDQSKVGVFDPADMTLQQEIRIAPGPVSIWCDAERLVVACRDARAILIFDMKTLRAIKAVEIDDPRLMPLHVVGRAPDGSFITLWGDTTTSDHCTLYLVDEARESLRVITRRMVWCTFPDRRHLWGQWSSSSPDIVTFKGLTKDYRTRDEFLQRHGLSHHDELGRGFLTQDSQRFLLPVASFKRLADDVGQSVRTLILTPDLESVVTQVPGATVGEYAAADCYVVVKAKYREEGPKTTPEIRYYNRPTGRMIRKVLVEGLEPNRAEFTVAKERGACIFVPGHELLLIRDSYAHQADVTLVRCGPILDDADSGTDQPALIGNGPPKSVTVGSSMSFTPSFAPPKDASEIVFRLTQTVSGMEIDPATGEISFTPQGDNLGFYDIAVVADVDGKQVPVINWRLEISLP